MELNFVESKLNKNMLKMSNKLNTVVLMFMATKAQVIDADMKSNRPWTDRTGLAKVSLSTKVSQPQDSILRITLAQGVEYGIWLELANEKRYAIISPTIKKQGPKLMADLDDLFKQIAGG